MKISQELLSLKTKIKEDIVVPFIGAGLSLEARTDDGRYPPSDKMLLDALINGMSVDVEYKSTLIKKMKRQEQTRVLKDYYGDNLGIQIRRLLSYERITPSQHQRILGLLRFNLLMTTNYDTIIEDVIYPRPELFITYNKYSIDYALNEISDKINKRPLLVKLNGCQSQPGSIALGTGVTYYEDYWLNPLKAIYEWRNNISLLFVGYSFGDNDFLEFFKKFRLNHGVDSKNYAIVTKQECDYLVSQPFVKELNIELIPFNPIDIGTNKLEYNGLWEILSQLKTQDDVNLEPGLQTGAFFEKDKRESYLDFQEKIEKKSTCLRYLTESPTNAISPEEYIREFCPIGLRKLYKSLEYELIDLGITEESWVNGVLDKMVSRKNTLEKLMRDGAEIRAICLEESIIDDANKRNKYLDLKYKYLLNKIDNEDYDLEIRMIRKGDVDKNIICSYALMGAPNSNSTDIAIAYATQADIGGFMLHVIERNTDFANSNLVNFEKLWARSVPEMKTREYIRSLFKIE